jgi:hypothetical protein
LRGFAFGAGRCLLQGRVDTAVDGVKADLRCDRKNDCYEQRQDPDDGDLRVEGLLVVGLVLLLDAGDVVLLHGGACRFLFCCIQAGF